MQPTTRALIALTLAATLGPALGGCAVSDEVADAWGKAKDVQEQIEDANVIAGDVIDTTEGARDRYRDWESERRRHEGGIESAKQYCKPSVTWTLRLNCSHECFVQKSRCSLLVVAV